MVDEKLIKTKRLKLTTAIYYKKLLEYMRLLKKLH